MNLSISQWVPKKLDASASAQNNMLMGASSRASVVVKQLVPKDTIAPVIAAIGDTRNNWFYKRTLPWGDGGWRILPASTYFDFVNEYNRKKQAFDAAVESFVASYALAVDHAKTHMLGKLFNESDYPSAQHVRERFSMELEFSPVPEGDDFRIDLGENDRLALAQSLELRIGRALREAETDLWSRLRSPIENIVLRLTDTGTDGKPNAFKSTLISNLLEVVEAIPALNLSSDPTLENFRREAKDRLTMYTVEALKASPSARKSSGTAASAVSAWTTLLSNIAAWSRSSDSLTSSMTM